MGSNEVLLPGGGHQVRQDELSEEVTPCKTVYRNTLRVEYFLGGAYTAVCSNNIGESLTVRV